LIDFVVVLLGYAISGEHMLEAFYERFLRKHPLHRLLIWYSGETGSDAFIG